LVAQAQDEFRNEIKHKGGYVSSLPDGLKPPLPSI
jgi:hypothetical protein